MPREDVVVRRESTEDLLTGFPNNTMCCALSIQRCRCAPNEFTCSPRQACARCHNHMAASEKVTNSWSQSSMPFQAADALPYAPVVLVVESSGFSNPMEQPCLSTISTGLELLRLTCCSKKKCVDLVSSHYESHLQKAGQPRSITL